METRVAMKTHGRPPRKFEQLLRRTWIERQRAGADEKVAQRREPSGSRRVRCPRERFHRLREAVVRARQAVGADDLRERPGERSPSRHGQLDLSKISAQRRSVLPQIDELAQRHSSNWIPLRFGR